MATRERPTQADRRARSRAALLEATARGISRAGYANLVLADVAAEAGYTRGALPPVPRQGRARARHARLGL